MLNALSREAAAEMFARLSKRERQVAAAVARDLSNKEIAAQLGISVQTVKEHIQQAIKKFDVEGRVGVAVIAVIAGAMDSTVSITYTPPKPEAAK